MIKRIWHGWTTHENADAYEAVLTSEVIPAIAAKKMAGNRGIEVLRREHADEVEFITIMTFDTLDAIRQFVGDDVTVAHIPPNGTGGFVALG